MAEDQKPPIQNKKLLIVALALALVVVVLFNVYVGRARQAGQGEKVTVVAYKKSLSGGIIKESHLEPVKILAAYRIRYPPLVDWSRKALVEGRRLLRPVQKGELVSKMQLAEYLPGGGLRLVKPDAGTVAYPFTVDRKETPGDILKPNSRIDVLGRFAVKDHRGRNVLKTLVVIEKVRVLTVGGRGQGSAGAYGTRVRPSAGQRSYDKITIQVTRSVAIQLDHIRSHAYGRQFKVLVLAEGVSAGEYKITKDVVEFADAAKAVGGR